MAAQDKVTTRLSFSSGQKFQPPCDMDKDLEQGEAEYITNTSVNNLSWHNLEIRISRHFRSDKQSRVIAKNISAHVSAGELCAIIGPSGCGKTSVLNALARRRSNLEYSNSAIRVNGQELNPRLLREICAFVPQEDCLTGSLTASEALSITSKLYQPKLSNKDRLSRVNHLLETFGLSGQANTLIGTPIRKGLSGGEKKRLSVALQVITAPRILFLDEPTSGLDSRASFEMIHYLRKLATSNGIIVVCSIHQPSTTTFRLFDKILLLSGGSMLYSGSRKGLAPYFESIGAPIEKGANPAEFLLEIANADFDRPDSDTARRLKTIREAWEASVELKQLNTRIQLDYATSAHITTLEAKAKRWSFRRTVVMLQRGLIKSRRDILAHTIRLSMFLALGILMGTVWLQLGHDQNAVAPTMNAIFFGSAFLSMMAIAYVPSYVEDYFQFTLEYSNGLSLAIEFAFSNFLLSAIFSFIFALSFTLVVYWLLGLNSDASSFFSWLLWLFLDLLAAESLVVLLASILPQFVGTLAIFSFLSGLWFAVGGFMVPPDRLNHFYKYVFYYWNFQSYCFEGLMVSQFTNRVYECGQACHCLFMSNLASQCKIPGTAVLTNFGYATSFKTENVFIMLAIVLAFRAAAWLVLVVKA
ncbi:hypothetical protein HIM_01532 [Hirsutella minnesotensis 3608]|nr:hypothetical protein HIM_01532 [Hirsutella minnesotensis 3608]